MDSAPPLPSSPAPKGNKKKLPSSPFRSALFRGLGIIMPPLLTLVLLIWVWNAIENYVLLPIEATARYAIVWSIVDIRETAPPTADFPDELKPVGGFRVAGVDYVRAPSGVRYFPKFVRDYVDQRIDTILSSEPPPLTANAYYHQYAKMKYLPRWLVVVFFLVVFIALLYIIGRAFAFGIGRVVVVSLERIVNRVPILRNIYSSVKQITDFMFGERDIEFTRVVAIEYPRHGIWTLGFVTGESMQDISVAANEAVLSVLIPTSPMPMTGFTMTVRKSEALDMNLTIDQALQFVVSCGVVVPAHQQVQFNRITQQSNVPFVDSSQGSPAVNEADSAQDNQPSE
jgi:uncharacterized membrane protein